VYVILQKTLNKIKRDLDICKGEEDAHLVLVLVALAKVMLLKPHYHCQRLSGNWIDHRYCHREPDLMLIYQKPEDTPTLF